MSDDELHAYFWQLVENIVEPLVEEARTHTTPSIERSVLLRMGFSSIEAKALVESMSTRGVLGHGAGQLVLNLARKEEISVREAGSRLIEGRHWEEVVS
jgi:D-ornithine 4,5-aminomutase subunit alpha